MNIFCSGIGGIGLSAYAAHMRLRGHDIFGSDRSDSVLLHELRKMGMSITLAQDGSGLPDNLDLFVFSEAIPVDAPERVEATKRGVRQISYFQALGEMTAGKNLISVCGTHGKSSTTAMAALVLVEAGLDPNVVVGTKVPQMYGKNWRRGEGDLWIVESCEYRRSFLYLEPRIILLTNADGDHFDAFDNAADYRNAFVEFLKKLPTDGIIIAHGSDTESMEIVRRSGKNFLNADVEALPALSIPGIHMQKNAQLVLALAKHLGLPQSTVRTSLESYSGSWRRMEVKGTTKNGVTVIDDYGHHPTEIKATLQGIRSAYPKRRIVCVFQPHTHDRTLKLWNEFAVAFRDADQVLLTSVYDARPDKDSERADEKGLAEAIEKESVRPCLYSGNLKATEELLRTDIVKADDVLLIMGAGDVTALAHAMMR